MPCHDIIVVGASAGGVEALIQLVAPLPQDLPAALFIVVHFPAQGKSILPQILNQQGSLHAAHAQDGEAIEHGRIYVAPPNYHLLVKKGYIRLVQGPKENSSRPAVDPLFRTAAKAYGNRVVGVVLSGTLDDGTAGLIDVKKLGGVAVVQSPDQALFQGMPKSAIEHVEVDHILPASAIASILVRLAHQPVAKRDLNMYGEREIEPDIVELDGASLRQQGKPGPSSGFVCPNCGGGLFQMQERDLLQYRCRVGHAFSAATLMAQQSLVQEEALWAAIRSLEERAELLTQMASNAQSGGHTLSAERFEAQAKLAQQRSDLIRQALFQGQFLAMVTSVPTDQVTDLDQPLYDRFNVVVFVTQAGGIKSLSHILPSLPANFPAALIVVQHLDTQSDFNLMVDAFSRPTTLPFKQAQAGEPLQPGMVYFASPNEHVFVTPNGNICLSQAAFVDLACPSADLLFGSVAAGFKERAIAVVLSGTGNDGAMGVQAIHKMGGKVIAQDQKTSEFFEMPQAAIATGVVDFVLPQNEIAATLVNLVMN